MEDFDVIEAGFSNADETINFGTRAIGYDSLYEISTIACLKCSDDSSGVTEVVINALVKNGKVFLTVNKSIKVFENTELSAVIFNTIFDSTIDTICVSTNEHFVLICLNNGMVNVFDVSGTLENNCLFSKNLIKNEWSNTLYIGSYVEHCSSKLISFVIVSSRGKVYRVGISLKPNNEDTSSKVVIISEEIYDFGFLIKMATFSYPNLFVNGAEMAVLNVETKIAVSDNSCNLKTVVNLGYKFLGLDEKGHLYRYCSLTLLIFPVDNVETLFEDIITIDDKDGSKQILAVTKKNEQGESFLQLLNQDFSLIFSLKIFNPILLIQLENSSDETLILSKIAKGGLISELRVQCICETEPELRVTKLIRKRRFEEAEKFAKTFNINPAIVAKARAQVYVDKTACTAEDVADLIKLLESIDDDYFKLQCCSNVECSSYEDVRRILNYGCTITPKGHCENKEDVLLLQRVLMDLLFKFDTYMAVHLNYDVHAWSRFSACDLIDELKAFLKNFQIEEAIIIFNRLDLVTIHKLTDEKIEEILSIFDNLPITIYQPFLPTFIPVTMTHVPSALPILVKWLQGRIVHLEKRDSISFPDSGIKFAEFILKLLKVEGNECMSFQRQCTLNKEGLNELAALMDALKGLRSLKKDFGISISLSEYLMGPKAVIRTLLNIVMTPEDFDHFLKEFLCNFMIHNQFDPNKMLLDEIKNLIKYDEKYWVKTVEVILQHITSVKIKLEAIKEILENAHVPWCDTIRKIGQNALQYAHPLVADIKIIFENEPGLIVLRNAKYKIKEKQITTINDLQFVVRRIVYINQPTMISDVYQLCKTPRDRSEVNIILVQHFIKTGKFEEAMSILDNNTKEEISRCSKWFFSYAEIAIDNKLRLDEQRDQYYSILGLLFKRLVENSDNKIEHKQFEDDMRVLRGVYNINKFFKRNITADDLRFRRHKDKIFEQIIEEEAENFDRGLPDIEQILSWCDKLAVYFSLEKDDILINFCQKLGTYDVVLKAAEHMYERASNSKNLCLIAILLLKYMGSYNTHLPNDSYSDSSDVTLPSTSLDLSPTGGDFSNDFLSGLKLVEKIIKKALLNAEVDDLSAVVEVMNWVNSCFYLSRYQENALQADLFKYMYHSEHTMPGFSTFVAIRAVFDMYCRFIGNFVNPNTRFLTYFNKDVPSLTEEQLQQEISLLPDTIASLCREGQHLTAYKLLTTLENGLRYARNLNPRIMEVLNSIIAKKCLPQLLHVVVSAKYIDVDLFQNLLLASQKDYIKYIEHYLKLYKRHVRKFEGIALVGIKLLDLHKVTSGRNVLVNAITTCKWWNKFKSTISSNIPYDVFFKINASARLQQLIGLDVMDVNLIKQYCDDFKLDLQVHYRAYLKSTLVNWKPDYEVKIDLNGKKSLIMKNDENSLHAKCQEIINVIKDKDSVFPMINEIYAMANFYHYEVFICILKILSNNGRSEGMRNDLPMLQFLKNYSRYSSPSQSEREHWYGMFPDSQVLDPLSEFRLPFIEVLFTYDIWNIIRPEINLKSYRCWFDAVNILRKNLKKDDICIYAVKDVVSSGVLGEDIPGSWILHPKFHDLFAEVDECVQHITDLERATSVVYHLMYHTPSGADKVNAAQLSYKYAQKYKENNPNLPDVEKAYTKVRNKYYSFSAMHILHTWQLVEEKYLQLVTQPEDLIEALYLDERILKQAESVNLSCPDINKAVDALGVLFDLHIRQIRYNLLNRWLSNSNIDIDLDSTAVISNTRKGSMSNDDNLKRATYLCSSGEKSFWQSYLLKIGMNEDEKEDSEQQSLSFRAKALKCFCAISDVQTITHFTGVTYKEFLNFIDKLSLLSELECLGIALNVESLDQYNKKDLLRRLSQVGKPVAIRVMATICMTYVIEDLRYWEFIINSSIKLGLFTEIRLYVDFLKNKCYKGFYINAWQVIVDNAFHLPNTSSKEELHAAYINNFLMIQSCPVLYSLNFEKILQKCLKTEKYEFAILLLQYLPDEKKDVYIKEILVTRERLLDLDNLSKSGLWGIQRVKSWLGTKCLL